MSIPVKIPLNGIRCLRIPTQIAFSFIPIVGIIWAAFKGHIPQRQQPTANPHELSTRSIVTEPTTSAIVLKQPQSP
ncbi:MAG: hypothetical protein AAGC93_07990 [Cyanobacteria bacterium P01_F01_bin.53]